MVIEIEELFVAQLQKTPMAFQQKFRRVFQQLKVVDKPTEVKDIIASTQTKNFYRLFIDKSRIGLIVKNNKLYIVCFLYNQYFE